MSAGQDPAGTEPELPEVDPVEEAAEASVRAELPPALVAMVRDATGDRADAVIAGLGGGRSPAFRANTLKGRPGALRAELTAQGIPVEPHPVSDWSFTTTAEGERALKASPAYLEGRLYSQGIASQLPALLGDVRAGKRVLDACAAPGGKAGLLAMRLGDGGKGLTACERAAVRFQKLTHTMRLMGADRVRSLCCDAREPPEAVARVRWDHILVDAPCTGSGTVLTSRPYSIRLLAEDYDGYAATRARIQHALVERAAAMLAPGGTLVYSTCSIDPRENEAVAAHALNLRAALEPVDLSPWGRRFLPGASGPGVVSFRGTDFPEAVTSACLRLWPCEAHEGFFVAMFRRRR